VRYRGAIRFDVSLNLDPQHPSHGEYHV
jgi:hypothetical protein